MPSLSKFLALDSKKVKLFLARSAVLSFEMPRRAKNSGIEPKYERFLIKNPLRIGNSNLAITADEGYKGQILVLAR